MTRDCTYHSLSEMKNIQRLKASYNYNRNKLLAEQKTSEAVTAEPKNSRSRISRSNRSGKEMR